DQRGRGRDGLEAHGRVPSDHRLDRRTAAGERRKREIEPEGELEQLARQVRGGTDAGRGEGVLARICPEQVDKLLHRVRRNAGINEQTIGRARRLGDGREVTLGVVGRLGVEARIDGVARGHEQDRVAVGRRLGGGPHAEIAARSGPVLGVELLAPFFRQLLRDQPRDHIGRPRGRERADDLDRTIGIPGALRQSGTGEQEHGAARQHAGGKAEHCVDHSHGASSGCALRGSLAAAPVPKDPHSGSFRRRCNGWNGTAVESEGWLCRMQMLPRATECPLIAATSAGPPGIRLRKTLRPRRAKQPDQQHVGTVTRLQQNRSCVGAKRSGLGVSMTDIAHAGAPPVVRAKLDGGFGNMSTVIVFGGVIAAALLFVAYSLYVDVGDSGAQTTTFLPYLLLFVALLIALGFEFVNGFHDTANAVATVIYTHSMPAHVAVVWSGFFNFLGVVLSSGAVAFGIISLLPVELILQVGTSAGFAMVFALLFAAIIWNLGTWYLGLPASSSHTLIGSIIGVGVANALMHGQDGTSGVD